MAKSSWKLLLIGINEPFSFWFVQSWWHLGTDHTHVSPKGLLTLLPHHPHHPHGESGGTFWFAAAADGGMEASANAGGHAWGGIGWHSEEDCRHWGVLKRISYGHTLNVQLFTLFQISLFLFWISKIGFFKRNFSKFQLIVSKFFF